MIIKMKIKNESNHFKGGVWMSLGINYMTLPSVLKGAASASCRLWEFLEFSNRLTRGTFEGRYW